MNTLLNGMKNATNYTYTENGARAKNNSSNALVDLFVTIGSLRTRYHLEVERPQSFE